jgi:hypothetical protein
MNFFRKINLPDQGKKGSCSAEFKQCCHILRKKYSCPSLKTISATKKLKAHRVQTDIICQLTK